MLSGDSSGRSEGSAAAPAGVVVNAAAAAPGWSEGVAEVTMRPLRRRRREEAVVGWLEGEESETEKREGVFGRG